MRAHLDDVDLAELRVSEDGKLVLVGPKGPTHTDYVWGPTQTDYVWAEITELYCSDNQLTCLPPLPKGLSVLNCSGNQLTSLPSLPESLEWLDCFDNQLTSLPSLPKGLEGLDCPVNQLTSLPLLPEGLKWLRCDHNPFNHGVDVECVPLALRSKIPKEVYDLYVTLVTQRKEKFRKVLLALHGRPKST